MSEEVEEKENIPKIRQILQDSCRALKGEYSKKGKYFKKDEYSKTATKP